MAESGIADHLAKLHRSLADAKSAGRAHDFRVSAVSEPFINERIGNCLVISRAGQGAMSVVYKAKQDVTDRIVAVKMMRAQLCCDRNNVKRFQREAKAISRMSHPNLLNVYDVGVTRTGQPYMIMDFIEGKSLGQMLAEFGAAPWQRVVPIFTQVCDAMQHAHTHGIIHRDLKPDNIMLVRAGNQDIVKVVDFGIVKLTDESQALSQRLTQTGEVWGSPLYMSPEQCMGKPLDPRTDIYSLGTVMYEMLTGRQVFTGKALAELVMKQLNQRPDSFSFVRPDLQIPAWLENIVMKALDKDPDKRFQSMQEFKQALASGENYRADTVAAEKPASLSWWTPPDDGVDSMAPPKAVGSANSAAGSSASQPLVATAPGGMQTQQPVAANISAPAPAFSGASMFAGAIQSGSTQASGASSKAAPQRIPIAVIAIVCALIGAGISLGVFSLIRRQQPATQNVSPAAEESQSNQGATDRGSKPSEPEPTAQREQKRTEQTQLHASETRAVSSTKPRVHRHLKHAPAELENIFRAAERTYVHPGKHRDAYDSMN